MIMRKVYNERPNWSSLAVIADNISKLYEDGLSFIYIFDLLQDLDISENYKASLLNVRKSINMGKSLEESFKDQGRIFPNFFVNMVGVGEKTGNISGILDSLNLFYSKLAFIKKFIINALSYPIIILLASLAVVIFLSVSIIPNFKDIYISLGKEIPKSFNTIINLKTFIYNNKILSICYFLLWGIAIPYTVFKFFLKDMLVRFLYKIAIYRKFVEYVNVMILTVIVRSGVNLIKGLEFCGEVDLLYNNKNIVKEIKNNILLGNPLSESMKVTNIFSKYTLAHIKLGEESGSLDLHLIQMEKTLFNNIQEDLNKKISMIQPLMIMFIGAMVCMFILIFVLPLFGEVI